MPGKMSLSDLDFKIFSDTSHHSFMPLAFSTNLRFEKIEISDISMEEFSLPIKANSFKSTNNYGLKGS